MMYLVDSSSVLTLVLIICQGEWLFSRSAKGHLETTSRGSLIHNRESYLGKVLATV